MDYLNEGAKFTCSFFAGAGMITCSEGSNSKAIAGSKMLTTGAKLKSKTGLCSMFLVNGVPQPCQCQLTSWLGFSTSSFACGNPLLTSASSNTCGFRGGKITCVSSGVSGKVGKGGFAPGIEIHGFTALIPLVSAVQQIKQKQNETGNGNKAGQAGGSVQAKAQVSEKQRPDDNLLCPGCEKQAQCSYFNATDKLEENENNSGQLKKNYNQKIATKVDDFDKYYKNIIDNYKDESGYAYPAHHVIPGKEVLNCFPRLVKMAHNCRSAGKGYVYDVNNALNCAMLVSKKGKEYGQQTEFMKGVKSYDAMSDIRLQWHLARHSYSFSNDELEGLKKRIEKYVGPRALLNINTYENLLKAELARLEASMLKNKVCRNTPQQKALFVRRMNAISRKVRNKLLSFSNKPSDSFPFYVSRPAYLYSFNTPKTGKIAIVRKVEGEAGAYIVKKYRVKHHIDNNDDTVVFTSIDDKIMENPHCFKADEKKESILFCGNIVHFLFVGDTKEGLLPFKPEYIYPELICDEKKLLGGDKKLLKWLAENQSEYVSPNRKINERLKGLYQ